MKINNDVGYDPIVRIKWVANYIGVNISTIYRWRNNPKFDFPSEIRLGEKLIGWRKSSIENWIQNRPLNLDE